MPTDLLCSECDQASGEVVARFCLTCKRTYLAGYICQHCGHEDVDPGGQEWGHEPHAAVRDA